MKTVYKITNKINNKVYIGSSTKVNKRWRDHINTAFNKNNSQYNYPLYRAFRKYGVENFSFEILKDDFLTIEEMQAYEHYEIIHYNSLVPNGYNQTTCTTSNSLAHENTQKHIKEISKKCALVNENNEILEIYDSFHDAAEKQGWDRDARASSVKRICDGNAHSCNGLIFRYLDENNEVVIPKMKTRKRRTAIYGIKKDNPEDIVYYESISEAARMEKIDRQSIGKCIAGSSRYSTVGGRIWRKVGEE